MTQALTPIAPPSETSSYVVRDVADHDMEMVQRIYAHHVLNGFASFETEPPDVIELIRRRDALQADGFPYLVAEHDGIVRAYAYIGPYRSRPAYRYTVENSVYVAPDCQRKGFGKAILSALIDRAEVLGFRLMVAVIGDQDNAPSVELHRRVGFERVGALPGVGFKHGRWVNSMIMQRALGEGTATPPPDT